MTATMESITEKLGFDPLTVGDMTPAYEDDNRDNPFEKLTTEELDLIIKNALASPKCWKEA